MQNEILLGDDFEPTCMAHPDTYLNKVVVGSFSGQLQLLNFASGKKLFTFDIAECSICCITPSPALDVVGLGLSDGCVNFSSLQCSSVESQFGSFHAPLHCLDIFMYCSAISCLRGLNGKI